MNVSFNSTPFIGVITKLPPRGGSLIFTVTYAIDCDFLSLTYDAVNLNHMLNQQLNCLVLVIIEM